MKIVRNISKIEKTGQFIQKTSENLQQEKINIQKYIKEIPNNYYGKDANEIVERFMEAINKIDIIINDFEYYGKYMQQLAAYDRENLETTASGLSQINSDMSSRNSLKNLEINKIWNTKINLGEINGRRY